VSVTLGAIADLLEVPCDPAVRALPIASVGIDSRSLGHSALWVAYQGERTHAAEHPAPGAVAAVTDVAGAAFLEGRDLPVIVVAEPRLVCGRIAAFLHEYPSRSMAMFGVTGTNGKTSVTHLIDAALQRLGQRTGLIGTLGAHVNQEIVPLSRTTPEAPELQELLARMRDADVDSVAMEVSSHALALGRVEGIAYDVSVFTNLSRDHLDFHQDMEDYFAAKARLFEPARSRKAVVCIDDAWGRRLVEVIGNSLPVVTYAMATDADVRVTVDRRDDAGMRVALSHGGSTHRGVTSLAGDFNALNMAAAWAALIASGHEAAACADAVFTAPPVPGRMERVTIADAQGCPLVVVDYAHTPEAVGIVLSALADTGRRLITVIGAGGDRDRDKRPLMGQIAAASSDVVIVTDDNPRSEPAELIRSAVLAGTRGQRAQIVEIPDRGEAIHRAVTLADAGDVVAILGKGAEQGQEINTVVSPFDDREEARSALNARMGQ
jgi:UDP-N-acetylmuramoyl-L-alanyl-D-glutamate--2,6-diaminopimelate ligase